MPRGRQTINITGRKFGRLTAIKPSYQHSSGHWFWIFSCDCGNLHVAHKSKVMTGHTQSCGCLNREIVIAMRTKHGQSLNKNSIYETWKGMWARCNNSNHHAYNRYGGRGINVCKRWNDFVLFQQDMGPKPSEMHTVERRDNDGNYEPSNCYWATYSEQNYNKRPRNSCS